jgi:signal transduction histidine kinase
VVTETISISPWPRRLAAVSALTLIALGLTVLIGWATRTYELVQILPHLPYMVKNTAACFLVCGLALLTLVLRGPRWVVAVLAGAVCILCVLTIFEYTSGMNLRTGELLGPTTVSVRPRSPGRVAPLAAICFTLATVGFLLTPKLLSKRHALLLGFDGSIIAALGLASTIGIWGNATLTALHSAVGLSVLGLGMLSLAWQAETGPAGTPPWLPASVSIAVIAATVGLWQALIDTGQRPFDLLPIIVLFGGCLVAPVFGLTVYLAQHGHAQATALRRSEAFLTEAQRLSRTGSFSWRAATDQITWSEQVYRIFEFDSGVPVTFELIGSRVHPEDMPLLRDMIERARSEANDFEYEHRLQMPDNSVKHLHLVAHATRGRDGRLEYIGAVQDVTERWLSEEALAKARSDLAHVARVTSLGALTASSAHEVNQPLSGIITNAGTCLRMLAADPPNVEGARETARRTIRDGNRASDVIKRLRALFTKKAAIAEPVDLNEAAREVIALSLSELQRSRLIVRTELADDLPPVTGDRVQLQQVILNLLLNALDAMSGVDDRPRQIVIKTEREENDGVCLIVRDSGAGFKPQDAEKLFEAFHTTKIGGMGIGLHVSRSIIESHHGRLWAVPNDGPGATFSFSIPCRPEIAPSALGLAAGRAPAMADAQHAMGGV